MYFLPLPPMANKSCILSLGSLDDPAVSRTEKILSGNGCPLERGIKVHLEILILPNFKSLN